MGMSLDELGDFAEQVLSERRFRGKQLFKWIYKRRVTDFDAMTDIAKATRAQLKEVAHISRMEVRAAQRSRDGTIKFLWGLHDGLQVESVLIPEDTRLTLCISTQVGCPLDCDFCVTGKGGYTRNLSKAEILGQVIQAQEHSPDRDLSNIVLMGMGEPLLNLDNVVDAMETAQVSDGLDLSHRRITLSTVGLIPQMAELGKRSRINLAISLHGTTEEQRTALMPINRKYPLADLVEALKAYPLRQKKLITIEYILIRGVNDTVADAKRLVRLLRKVPAKVNLIPYNKNPFTQYERPDNPTIVAFQEVLMGAGLHTVTRLNRGGDIDAACGQLGGYKQQRPGKRRSASPKAEQGR
ncbi:MAG TPA: 23S rRNA (adenine(2503)-C(2))-methyltransferase RlmN [Deltaproteobacteria bacterium]|nr:23S rRNA (adenine(2503)-C(2))-methyltransferase RlmN [Deltaproteobacteria bacterium]HCP47844.1 23S rRNA (adenine(2503)-C(2))-methyltransferase RlmN [Deltaproteobacteria bacterium]